MTDRESHPVRKQIRLANFDYSRAGAYFVTVCLQEHACLFGDIADGVVQLNDAGQIVSQTWQGLANRYSTVAMDEFVVMPNHIHGIVWLDARDTADVGALLAAPQLDVPATRNQGAASSAPTLGGVMRAFKSLSAIAVNKALGRAGLPLWQRNYYEHVIRNERELNLVREYIVNNPLQWLLDRENPAAVGRATSPEFVEIFGKELP